MNDTLRERLENSKQFYYDGWYSTASDFFDEILEVEPNNIDALAYKAKCLVKMGSHSEMDNYSKALKYYEKLIQLDPDNINHYDGKMLCLGRLGRGKESIYIRDFIFRKFRNTRDADDMLFHVTKSSDFEHSLAFLDKAINQHPEEFREFYLFLKKQCLEAKKSAEKQNKKNCYIATACYGSYDCTQVLTFRNFRDEYLSQTLAGRLFIKTYYALSPSFAKWLENQYRTNAFIRERFLELIYKSLKDKY